MLSENWTMNYSATLLQSRLKGAFFMKFIRSKFRLSLVCFTVACLGVARPAWADDNVVIQWNQALLQAVRNTRTAPPIVARALAITHTCMFDAWAAYDDIAVGTRFGRTLRRPRRERTQRNKEQAISFAAYRALVDLFPTQTALFDGLMNSLGYNPSDTTTNTSTPTGIGNVVAAAVLAFRHHDGSNQLGNLNPGAYSDYTGYAPVNTPDRINDPNRWQPLRMPNGQIQSFLLPHWGNVIPFALNSSAQFRPGPPAVYPSRLYRNQALDLLHLSANLNDRRKVIIEYWADGPGSETPPGHWCLHAQFVSQRDAHTLDEDVMMFFALGNALLDAGIAVWECKRFYDYVRPVTAIHFLFKNKQVRAWGGPGLGTQTINGEDWQSYIATPPFAEYASGHSTFSAASAEILASFTGSDAFGAAFTFPAGASVIEPGITPGRNITLSWATFSQAADEAGISRRYGGIHFEEGDLRARALGRRIGALVWEKATTFFDGTAQVEP
jgi:hypothetical protein